MQIVVEKMKAKDVDDVVKLGSETPEFRVGPESEYYSTEELLALTKSKRDISLTAKIENQLAGFLTSTFNEYLKEACLTEIVVDKKFRGKGIGKALIKRFIEELEKRGCTEVWMIVHEDNKRMMNFIKRQGFIKGRKFYCYYRNF